MTFARIAHSVVLSWGWRRILIAFAAGAATALALPPLSIWPIPFLTFPVLVWLLDGAADATRSAVRSAAVVGWWFGFGYFLAGLYWIGHAFLVDAKTFAWLLPFAVVLLPAGLAFFPAFGLALARLLWSKSPVRVLALAAGLTIAEWLRGHVLTGFPWNAFGYALATPLPLAQTSALIGLWNRPRKYPLTSQPGRSSHCPGPLCRWIGRRHELRSDAAGCPEGRVVESGEILFRSPTRRLRAKLFAPL